MNRDVSWFSSGLAGDEELALAEPPPGVWRFAENFLVAAYDPAAEVGLWTHLGTWPDDFGLWEDEVLCSLPGDDGMLWSFGYHRTEAERRPAGAGLAFRCVEPFRHWHATYDGVVVRTPYDEARTGRVRDGDKELLRFDLDLECVAPAWDPAAAHGADMAAQSWASRHYQQLIRATGEMHLEDRTIAFEGFGARDHSRGQRGHAVAHFGGHDLFTAAFPSGNAFGMMQMWDPTGAVNLAAGYVVLDGVLHHAEIVEAPRLPADFAIRGEELTLVLRSPVGVHELRATTMASVLATARPRLGMAFGADGPSGETVLVPGFARWEWDGELAYGLTERSDRFT